MSLWNTAAASALLCSLAGSSTETNLASPSASISEKIESASAVYLGRAYRESPLGEDAGVDPDPRMRNDVFDCLTLVETVLAEARTSSVGVLEELDGIRYHGPPTYGHRNHLVEAQWIPHNEQGRRVQNISGELSTQARDFGLEITAEAWRSALALRLAIPPQEHLAGFFSLPAIPVSDLLSALRQADSGTILFTVRKAKSGRLTRVSHAGFLIQKKGQLIFRHASKSHRQVVDEPLQRYLRRNLNHGAFTVEAMAAFRPLPR